VNRSRPPRVPIGVRTIQDIDAALALVVKVRATARSFGARPTTDFADQLLDERLEIRTAAWPSIAVQCAPRAGRTRSDRTPGRSTSGDRRDLRRRSVPDEAPVGSEPMTLRGSASGHELHSVSRPLAIAKGSPTRTPQQSHVGIFERREAQPVPAHCAICASGSRSGSVWATITPWW
jgi:hypothetical protein